MKYEVLVTESLVLNKITSIVFKSKSYCSGKAKGREREDASSFMCQIQEL